MNAHVRMVTGPVPRPVHILYVIDELCRLGGAERMLLNTIRRLPAERFRCSLVTFKMNPSLQPILSSLPCSCVILPLRKTYDWNALQVARKLRHLILAEDVSIVHTFFETADLWGGLVSKFSGGRILISSRRDMGIYRSAKHRIAYRALRRQFDVVLTVSEAVRRFTIAQDGVAPERVRTLYNSIEPKLVSMVRGAENLRIKLGLSASAPLIVTVANVRRVKGMDVLFRAAAIVAREFPEATFLVAGGVNEQQYFVELEALIKSLSLQNNARFLGEVEDARALLGECDIFCLPSRSEGFSNALIEAMQAGLPSVATRVGGNAEALTDGANGYIIESENPEALADRILRLLRDPELRLRMGSEARRAAESRFSMEAMMTQLTDTYDELMAAKHV